jgi:UDP-N-acetylglucosamine--N-acetylmuramyl-(pentapeptide) pyrophosphoryl-undecaprenol N-acetylglucosamine transferase
MRVLIAGGGTGGHIYPGIVVAQHLQAKGAKVLFVGTKKGMEADIIPRYGFDFTTISSRYIPRRISPAVFVALASAGRGFLEAAAIVRDFHPDVVVGMGGYVAGPMVLMAAFKRVPTLIHEQNAYPGVTNKILARFVSKVALGYREAARYLPAHKVVVTGNPVRPEITKYTREEGRRYFGFANNKKVLLVAPGSQGARQINQAMLDAAEVFHLRQDLQVLHATGKRQFDDVKEEITRRGGRFDKKEQCCYYGNYKVVPYIYDMPQAYAAADLLVGRGGALSSAEITLRGLPALLVPYPHSAENHQLFNARVLEANGAAWVLLDKDVNGNSLSRAVLQLLDAPATLAAMQKASHRLGKPEAADDVLRLICELAKTKAK